MLESPLVFTCDLDFIPHSGQSISMDLNLETKHHSCSSFWPDLILSILVNWWWCITNMVGVVVTYWYIFYAFGSYCHILYCMLCLYTFEERYILWQVTASAWLNDLRNQIEHTRIFSTVYRSASALGSRLPSIASARAKVAGAGAILRPVSNGTQVSPFY